VDRRPHLGARLVLSRPHPVDLLQQPPQQLPVGSEDAVPLTGELLVEGERGDAGALRGLGDRCLRVAALCADLRHRRDPPFALVAGDYVGGDSVRPRRQATGRPLLDDVHSSRLLRVSRSGE
jgi:hypothetical protein